MKIINLTVIRLLLLLLAPVYSLTQQAEWEWAKHAGEASDQIGKAITADDGGNVYFTRYFINKVIFENDTLHSIGGGDIYLAKYDSDGNKCWVKQAGGVKNDLGHDITIDKSGNIFITGFIGGNGLVYNNGILYLKAKDLKSNANLEILNIKGYTLYESRLSDGIHLIDIQNYPPGLYFVRIFSEGYIKTKKIVKH